MCAMLLFSGTQHELPFIWQTCCLLERVFALFVLPHIRCCLSCCCICPSLTHSCTAGTPILSRPLDLYSQLQILRPGLLGTYNEFGLRYCTADWMREEEYRTSGGRPTYHQYPGQVRSEVMNRGVGGGEPGTVCIRWLHMSWTCASATDSV